MSEDTPPRGDAAWQAERRRIAKRNEAAYARARKERDDQVTAMRRRRMAADQRERDSLPTQPGTHPPGGGR